MDKDWAEAINGAYETEVVKPEEIAQDEEEDKEDEVVEEEQDDTPADDAPDDSGDEGDAPVGDEDDGSQGDDEGTKKREDGAADDPEDDGEKPVSEPLSKDSIKEALRELNAEDKARTSELGTLKNEVIEALYPEGLDRQLRDSDGDPITGIEDLTKLVNPATNEYFTDEEAGQWLLSNQQKLNRDIENIEKYAAEVADTHIALRDGTERVKEVYGEFLEKNPDIADELMSAYDATLVKDEKSKLIIKAPVDVVTFYSVALKGHMAAVSKQAEEAAVADAAKAAAEKAEADKKAAEEEAALKAEQEERGDLPPNKDTKPSMSKKDGEWVDAYKSYYEG